MHNAGRDAQNDAASAQFAGQSVARQSSGADAAYTQAASPLTSNDSAGGNGGSPQSRVQNAFASSAQSRAPSEMPKTMPRFSALAEQAPENESPFYNGGAVPPEQAAAKGDERPAMPSEMQPPFQSAPSWGDDFSSDDFNDIDESDETSIDEGNGNDDAFQSVPAWEDDGVSDDFDDGDDSDESDVTNDVSDDADAGGISGVAAYIPPLPAESAGGAQDETQIDYVTGGGRTITLAQLRGSVIAELGIHDAPTAAALMTTSPWQISGDVISTQASTAYQKAQLERQRDAILRTLEKVCERRMDFSVSLKEAEEVSDPSEVPQQIKILCGVFKGSIVGGKI